jgi:hypothetical protein
MQVFFVFAKRKHFSRTVAQRSECFLHSFSEPAPTSAPPWRMNGKCSGNSFLLGFSSLANHGG